MLYRGTAKDYISDARTLNEKNIYQTSLHIVAEKSNEDTLITLFKYKKNLNYRIKDSNGHTPSVSAIMQGKPVATYTRLMQQAEYYHATKENFFWILNAYTTKHILLVRLPKDILNQIFDYVIHPAKVFFERDHSPPPVSDNTEKNLGDKSDKKEVKQTPLIGYRISSLSKLCCAISEL